MVPFTTLKATLKQVKTDQLDAHSRELLDGCFPEFLGQQKIADWLVASDIQLQVTSKSTLPATHGRLRRYAGGPTLPGGRYFSVANDSSGADGGTLVWELMSYWTSRAKLFPDVVDSTVHVEAADAVRSEYPQLVGTAPFLLLITSEVLSVKSTDDGPKVELGPRTGKVLPLEVHHYEVDRVVDLRLPKTQAWFVDHFGALEVDAGCRNEFNICTAKHRPGGFKELLPTLLNPLPGGSAFHQAVGAWLRNNGAFGFVFPSARRNGCVEVNGEDIRRSDGWNFVLYHGAPRVRAPALFGVEPKWLLDRDVGVEIEDWQQGDSQVSWKLGGLEQGERRRYDLQWAVRAGRIEESLVWESRFGARER